ncbi:MAG: tetratricopeptide repeat protein [Candidatus Latescibacterota bacterium]|nr:MAG: tetratricopeptide repeat protein [Candidatus Latescibacterota bacterium]
MNKQGPANGTRQKTVGRLMIGAGLLLIISVVVYIPAFDAGFYADDDGLLVRNERLQTTDGLGEIWSDREGTYGLYYPLTFTTYWIEYQLWGLNPPGYHVNNVILHAINALLVWIVLRRLRLPWAWFAAAVFALHPVHVESVAWVTERRNTLSGLFYLLSLLAYLGFQPIGDSRRAKGLAVRPHRRWVMYALSMTFFVAALLSKTVTLTLPAAILLLMWWRRGRLVWRDTWPVVPFFVVGIALSFLTVGLERSFIQEGGPGWGMHSTLDRFLIAGRVVWFYLGKVLFPVRLAFHYPRWTIDAHLWWQHLYPAAAIALLVTLFCVRRRLGRGPLAALLFFGGTLVPVLGFVDYFYMTYSFVADRFLYLPSIGMITLVVAGAATGIQRLGPTAVKTARAVCVVVLVVLGAGVWQRSMAYETTETLYRDVLAKYPDAWLAHYSLGCVLGANNRPDEAITHLEAALRLKPNFPAIRGYLGVVYSQVGRYDDALRMYQEALRQHPDDEVIRTNLGFTYIHIGEYDKGIEEYTRALQINPHYEPALRNLAQFVLYRIDSLFEAGEADAARDFAGEARGLATRLGVQQLVSQIDQLVRQHTPPQQ